ncbi:pilus assembly protein [Cupriavidus necator]|uniref:Pilus assembly protein n=1 Tax=Cupriavidus necator TaxID=106590 RepID=A0A1U9UMT6_CUPNE|nr:MULTISPECIES: type IV pilin protein [Cupriavidus]AQV94106.1 pilus assembly protein [Cupriavidus necator]
MTSKKISAAGVPCRQRAFTLIELMITVAIVAILATVAYPSYISSVVKGRRSSAQAALMDVAQRQQQYLLDARAYASSLAGLNVALPPEVSAYYTITITASAGPPPAFTATATPIAGTSQAADVTLTINNAGAKTPTNTW